MVASSVSDPHGTTDTERTNLEARKDRLFVDYDRMDATLWRTKMAAIDAKLAEIARQEKAVDRLGVRDPVPPWSDVEAMNAHLRRIWTRVTLDENMTPTVEWGVPEYFYNVDAADAREAEIEAENPLGIEVTGHQEENMRDEND